MEGEDFAAGQSGQLHADDGTLSFISSLPLPGTEEELGPIVETTRINTLRNIPRGFGSKYQISPLLHLIAKGSLTWIITRYSGHPACHTAKGLRGLDHAV